MKKAKELALDFEIDKLTNSIQNTISGDSFPTEIALITKTELKQVTKKNGWAFNWKKEKEDSKKQVYKLTIVNNSGIIQGLISLSIESDHVFMNLVESAPFNIGKSKLYAGVAGIWSPMHARLRSKEDLMVSWPLMQKQSLLLIMKKHWALIILVGEE